MAVEKAALLSDTFLSKSKLPVVVQNKFTDLKQPAEHQMTGFIPVRKRNAYQVLKGPDADSSTGPDGVPGRILKTCAASLALPVALLSRCILRCGVWPRESIEASI